MNPAPQDSAETSEFLSFDTNKNNDESKNIRNNSQYRPYNRNRYHRNQNFRQNQWVDRNDGDPTSQFAPTNSSSPVGGQQYRYNDGFHNRQHHRNKYQRNYTPFRVSALQFV